MYGIDRNLLKSRFPAGGWHLKKLAILSDPKSAGVRRLKVQVEREGESQTIRFNVWVPDQDGVYDIHGSTKVLIYRGIPGPGYSRHPHDLDYVQVQTPSEVLTENIARAIGMALSGSVSVPTADLGLEEFFGTSPLFRTVDPSKPLTVLAESRSVLFDLGEEFEDRKLKNWERRIDYLSTTQGSKICRIFRLAAGAFVERGRIKAGRSLLCDVTHRNLVFPENNRPHRLLPLRSALQYHEALVRSEPPTIRHMEYEDELTGVHLLTGVMDYVDNYDDCYIISQTAADRLRCWVYKNAPVLFTASDFRLLVDVGDLVKSRAPLIDQGEDLPTTRSPFPCEAEVTKIEVYDTVHHGEPTAAVRVRLRTQYPMEDGCKLIQRHGNKGVVKILPDHKMPRTVAGAPLEVLVHPKSIEKRLSFGIFREMMANRKYQQHKNFDHFSQIDSIQELVDDGYGAATGVVDRGVERQVFCGPLYWLRTKDHAQDKLSAVGDIKVTDENGLNPDHGKTSGQRMNLDIALVLEAKGLGQVFSELTSNIEPGAVRYARQIYEALTV